MVVFNYSGGEINTKIVYYGPGLSGKTTNLEYIYSKMPIQVKGKMISMKTRTDRTLFFDFLPLDLGDVSGFKVRFLLYTVPGQVYYNATRKLVLKGADAVIFVADSARDKLRENIESLKNLEANLNEHDLSLDTIPWVIQYNKRDLEDALPVAELEESLNVLKVPSFEAVAADGRGVYETFQTISSMLYRRVKRKLDEEEDVEVPAPVPAPAAENDARGKPEERGNKSPDVSDVVDTALREITSSGHEKPSKLQLKAAGVRASGPDEAGRDTSPPARAGRDEHGSMPAGGERPNAAPSMRGAQAAPGSEEFRFASLKDIKIDDRVGRVVDLSDEQPAVVPREIRNDFVTDPCKTGNPSAEERPAAPPGSLMAEDAKPAWQAADELLIRVPVLIRQSQVQKNIPLKLVLEIQVVDE